MKYIIVISCLVLGFILGVAICSYNDWHDYRIVKEGGRIIFEIDGFNTFFVDCTSKDNVIEFKARKLPGIFEIEDK